MRSALVITLALVACSRTERAAPDASVGPAPSSSAAKVVEDAGARSPAAVDLLHTVPSVVAVSSKVDNPKDFPEHLVDGKKETAWNGRTGDLVDGWIAFRVPAETRVKRIELTAGFDKKNAEGDLFAMNHRVSRIRISRLVKGAAPTLIKEVDLNPTKRELQGFDVDEVGGDFEIRVLAVVPGFKTTWRELTISELRVLGTRGTAPDNPSHLPTMLVGSLDGNVDASAPVAAKPARPALPVGPFPTPAELCAAILKVTKPAIDAEWGKGLRYPGEIITATCEPADADLPGLKRDGGLALPSGRVADIGRIVANDVDTEFNELIVKTARGWSRTGIRLGEHNHGDPGCGPREYAWMEHSSVEPVPDGSSILALVKQTSERVFTFVPNEGLGGAGERATLMSRTCRVDTSDALTCERSWYELGAETLSEADHEARLNVNDPDDSPWRPAKWTGLKKLMIGTTGQVMRVPAN